MAANLSAPLNLGLALSTQSLKALSLSSAGKSALSLPPSPAGLRMSMTTSAPCLLQTPMGNKGQVLSSKPR